MTLGADGSSDTRPEIKAVLFDLGGVLTAGPWESFARYERDRGLPDGLIRKMNSTNPDTNAWAQLERGEVDFVTFCALFESEAEALGHQVDAAAIMSSLGGDVRPEMVEAVQFCRGRFKTAALSNTIATAQSERREDVPTRFAGLFDVIIESSKVGVRKPDPRFYQMACDALAVDPTEAVFLDDLGINLKPARQMGMQTIKVVSADQAIAELYEILGVAPVGWEPLEN